jgi:3-hydroxyisobutyrate dehydrogenase
MSGVAFIGAGEFGGRLARRLLARGEHDVVVCDRDPEIRATFEELGAHAVATASECAPADLVIVFVATGDQVRDCLLGDRGLVAGVAGGGPVPLVAIGSTIAPDIVIEVGAALADHGIRTIDVPSTGAIAFAERGEIEVLAGGAVEDVDAARPVLDQFSRKVLHAGPLGSGQKLKILNNLLSISSMYLTAEAIRIGVESEMPIELVLEAINDGSGRNFWTLLGLEGIAEQYAGYTSSSAYWDTYRSITSKDLALAAKLSADAGVSTPILDVVAERVRTLERDDEFDHMRLVADAGAATDG